jgi:hypothetical protein
MPERCGWLHDCGLDEDGDCAECAAIELKMDQDREDKYDEEGKK